MCEKTTKDDGGNDRYESLRTKDGDKGDHQHTYVVTRPDGTGVKAGATPGKREN